MGEPGGESLAAEVQSLCSSIDIRPEAAHVLGVKLEEAVKGLLKDASEFARHSRRKELDMEDINGALELRSCEPIYGGSRFRGRELVGAQGMTGICFGLDREIKADEIENLSFTNAQAQVVVQPHWLAIEGVQPVAPENRPTVNPAAKRQRNGQEDVASTRPRKKGEKKGSGNLGHLIHGDVEIRLPVVPTLGAEHRAYFDKIQAALESAGDEESTKEGSGCVLENLTSDAALQPLIPYLIHFLTLKIRQCLHNTATLQGVLQIMNGLIKNPHLDLQHYSHHLLPLILTSLLSADLGDQHMDQHWKVRRQGGRVLQTAVHRFSDSVNNLRKKIADILGGCLVGEKPFTTLYGAVVGITCLGVSDVPSMAPLLAQVSQRLENSISGMHPKDPEYQQAIQCRVVVHEALESYRNNPEELKRIFTDSIPDNIETQKEHDVLGQITL